MRYFKAISVYGDLKAKYNTAIIFANKRYKYHSYKKAYDIFLQLALDNYPKAQVKVGIFLLYGLGVKKDYDKALKWFEYAYFKNHYKPAVCNLAYMFANGYGALFNFGRASKLAKIGIKENYPLCKKIYKDYKLYKYKEDRGFKDFRGYYK